MRTYISLAPATMQRLDSLSEKFGVSRSALISIILGQYCESAELALKSIPGAISSSVSGAGAEPQVQR